MLRRVMALLFLAAGNVIARSTSQLPIKRAAVAVSLPKVPHALLSSSYGQTTELETITESRSYNDRVEDSLTEFIAGVIIDE